MKIQFDVPPSAGPESHGLAVQYAAAKRRVPRWRWYLLLLLVVTPPLYFALKFAAAFVWDTAPGFVVLQQVTLKAGVPGYVAELAPQGKSVPEGALLATLIPASAGAPEAMPAQALDTRAAAGRVDHARVALALAEQQRRWREGRRSTVERLAAQGAATAAERDTAQAQWVAAQADVNRAYADLAAATLQLEQARALPVAPRPASAASGTQAVYGVRAPFAGAVTRTMVVRHEWVTADTEVAVLQGDSEPSILAYVQPSDAEHARLGTRASLRFFDGGQVGATVIRVEAEAARLPAERVGPLSPRGQSIIVVLKPDTALPPRYRINYLPLDARFNRW